eukprot:3363090-Prymnesium_polylepis.1
MQPCCVGRTLRVGLAPQSYEPMWTYDSTFQQWHGFAIEYLSVLEATMGFTLVKVPIPLPTTEVSNIYPLLNGDADAVFAMVSRTLFESVNASEVHFTTSFKETTYTGLVTKSPASPAVFKLFDPLTPALWGAIVASVMLAALLIVVIDALKPVAARPTSWQAFGRSLAKATYHTWAAML